jgi:hypothetical protein
VHTVDAGISNGEVIMQIVLRAVELGVEDKIAPNGIDQIATEAIGSRTPSASDDRPRRPAT